MEGDDLRRRHGDVEGHVDQVAELAFAARAQGLRLLQPVAALLQLGFCPQQIQPRHQTRLLEGLHLIFHQAVVAHHRLAHAPQLFGELEAVVGQADVELKLA